MRASGEGQAVRLDIDRGSNVATLALHRPPLNALDQASWRLLAELVDEVSASDDVRALVVHGGGRALAAGADVREFLGWSPEDAASSASVMHGALDALAALPVVTIAVVTGYALGGGCELALACDLRFAADNAKMGQPEILLGVIPGAGGTQRLPRLVGIGRAKDLILTGRMVDMVEGLRIGLVDRVLPADEVLASALDAAAAFAAGPAALLLAKRTIEEGMELPFAEAMALERRRFSEAFASEDARIGVRSFLENGPGVARFSGR